MLAAAAAPLAAATHGRALSRTCRGGGGRERALEIEINGRRGMLDIDELARAAHVAIEGLMDELDDLGRVRLGLQSVMTGASSVRVTTIASKIEGVRKTRVRRAGHLPRFPNELPMTPPPVGPQPVHAPIEDSEAKAVLGEETRYLGFAPIRAITGPLDKDTSTDREGVSAILTKASQIRWKMAQCSLILILVP